MPKKATSSSRIPTPHNDGTQAGYFMYADGSSAWGAGLHRGMEKPLRITDANAKEIHTSNVDEKLAWHKAKQVELAEIAKSKK